MRHFSKWFLVSILTALLILRSGAQDLALCVCEDGGIELQSSNEPDCCSDESVDYAQEGVASHHGPSCTDCFVILLPTNQAEPTFQSSTTHVTGVPDIPPLVRGFQPFRLESFVAIRSTADLIDPAKPQSRTVVLRR